MNRARAIVLALLAGAAAALLVALSQMYVWLVTVQPRVVYPLEPITIKVWSVEVTGGSPRSVYCNLTVTNSTDFIAAYRFNGTPAIQVLRLNASGSYELYLSCVDSDGNEYQDTFNVTVVWPRPRVEHDARWGRPVTLRIESPYPYNTSIDVYAPGYHTTVSLVNGVGEARLPAYNRTFTVKLCYFGECAAESVTPKPPMLKVEPAAATLYPGDSVNASVLLADDLGVLGAPENVDVNVAGPCTARWAGGKLVVTGIEPGSCRVIIGFNATVAYVTAAMSVSVEPVPVELDARILTIDNWTRVLDATMTTPVPVNYTLLVLLDGRVVGETRGAGTAASLATILNLVPGKRNVTVAASVCRGSWCTVKTRTIIIDVPRFPVRIPLPGEVPAGGFIKVNASYATLSADGYVVVQAFYPGNSTHAPAYAAGAVKLVEPMFSVTTGYVTVRGAPGARVTIYCSVNGSWLLVVNETLENDTIVSFRLGCDAVIAEYRYGDLVLVKTAYAPPPPPSSITVGLGERIDAVVDGLPGLAPPPGYHVAVTIERGHVVYNPVYVDSPWLPPIRWRHAGNVYVVLSPYDEVTVVLETGMAVTLRGPGEHTLPFKPLAAYITVGGYKLAVPLVEAVG